MSEPSLTSDKRNGESAEKVSAESSLAKLGERLFLPIIGIFELLLLFAIYIAAPVLVPIATALLLSLLLSPAVGLFERLRVPRPLSAAIVVLGLLAGFTASVYALAGPASG